MSESSERIEARLREIEAYTEKATPGPWHPVVLTLGVYVHPPKEYDFVVARCNLKTATGWQDLPGEVNAAFIANARTDLPLLLAVVRAALRVLETSPMEIEPPEHGQAMGELNQAGARLEAAWSGAGDE